MIRRSALVALFVSGHAFASVELPNFDAFFQSTQSLPLKLDGLSAPAAALVERGRVATHERRLGVPTFFWAGRDGRGLRELALTPEQAARRYLFAYAELYRAVPGQLAEARLHRLHDTGQGAIVAAFQRDADGARVFNDELHVVMNQRLELIALTGYLTPARRRLGEFTLGSDQAVALGWAQLQGRTLTATLRQLPTDEAGFERFALADQPEPVRVRRVWYPLANGLEPSWHVELSVADPDSTGSALYTFVVSATDGRLLFRKNLTQADFSYRVWADATGLKAPFDGPQGNAPTPHPSGVTGAYNPAFVAPNLVTLGAGPISTNDAWLRSSATETDGNNAVAYADIGSPDGFTAGRDLKATVTAPGVFDRTYDVTLQPGASDDQRMAAVTQLFYNVNFFHDWYYDSGFDERSGNAQASNYGRGGVQGDALYAEAQDYSGTDNANMSTPSDGAHPRMQMYVFTGANAASVAVQGGPTYRAGVADFGPASFSLTGQLVLVNDGDTTGGGTVSDGCTASWSTPVTGKIAVIDRGLCTFSDKVMNAQANGAIGAIILNNSYGGAIPLSGSGPSVTIGALSMGRSDGNALKMRLAAGTTTGTLSRSNVINRDGTIDNQIVAHEWGHYISNRLIGDGNGIANNQGGGMGEGWGDFHSMLLSVKQGDELVASNAQFNGTYGMAAYTTQLTDPNGYYWGIRRVPYSTNMMKNPLTFKHVSNGVALPGGVSYAFGASGSQNAEVHNTGEVWATMLWECYAALLRDSGRLTFAQAQDRMKRYLVAAYKITPLVPTFVDARDAVLASAAASDPTDFALFAAAFAKRGLGMLAVAPDKDSVDNKPVTESFVTGNAFQIVKVELDDSVDGCDHDGHLDVGETGRLTVTIKNVGVGLLSSTAGTVKTSSAGVTVASGGGLQFGSIAPFASGSASVEVSAAQVAGNSGAMFDLELNEPSLATPGPVRQSVQFRLNYDAKSSGSIADDVEAPMTVWTFGNNPNGDTSSDFRRYEDSGTSHWFFGPNPDAPADTYLVSPPLDVGQGPFSFSFSHRYQFEGDAMEYFDGAVVELSQDSGRSWADLGPKLSQPYTGQIASNSSNPLRGRQVYSGESAGYPAFSTVSVDLGTAYAGKTVQVRFRIGSDDALGKRGWELDNLSFVGLSNRPFPSVVVDPNLCTNRPPVLAVQSTRYVYEGQPVTLTAAASDPDNEPVTVTWTQVAGPLVTMEDGDSFVAPTVAADTALDFEVVASDGRATSAPATQRVIVRNVDHGPLATVSPAAQTVDEKTVVTLTGSAVDEDGDAIAGFRWVQTRGPAVGLQGEGTATLTFTAPEVGVDTALTFELYATDGKTEGPAATAQVTVRNVPAEVITPPANPKGCGCGAGGQGSTAWLAAALALLLVMARKRGQ